MTEQTCPDNDWQIRVAVANWKRTCYIAIVAQPPKHTDRTGGDPSYAYAVVRAARAIYCEKRKERMSG